MMEVKLDIKYNGQKCEIKHQFEAVILFGIHQFFEQQEYKRKEGKRHHFSMMSYNNQLYNSGRKDAKQSAEEGNKIILKLKPRVEEKRYTKNKIIRQCKEKQTPARYRVKYVIPNKRIEIMHRR